MLLYSRTCPLNDANQARKPYLHTATGQLSTSHQPKQPWSNTSEEQHIKLVMCGTKPARHSKRYLVHPTGVGCLYLEVGHYCEVHYPRLPRHVMNGFIASVRKHADDCVDAISKSDLHCPVSVCWKLSAANKTPVNRSKRYE